MRNVATVNARSDLIFTMESNFLFPKSLLESLEKRSKELKNFQRKCLVIPAFQTLEDHIPQSKEEVVKLFREEKATQFHSFFAKAHGPVDYLKWTEAQEDYLIPFENINNRFEPYIVIRKDLLPSYDERFRGRGCNKVSSFWELARMKVEFQVAHDLFIVHVHQDAKDVSLIKSDAKAPGCVLEKSHREFMDLKYTNDGQLNETWSELERFMCKYTPRSNILWSNIFGTKSSEDEIVTDLDNMKETSPEMLAELLAKTKRLFLSNKKLITNQMELIAKQRQEIVALRVSFVLLFVFVLFLYLRQLRKMKEN